MDTEQWGRVKNIFHQALTLEENERETFVRKETSDDDALYQMIMTMLDTDNEKNLDTTQVVSSNMKQFLQDNFGVKSGDKIDVYQLETVLGEGGMGTVFKARRVDAEFDIDVAIKVIHREQINSETLQRFQSERQILANLNHPNIARLIDGGTTDNGLPYLVMEYIEGEPIIDYCKSRKLNLNQRLKLFLQICEAVNYAHQNLIVHRDIKPANIMVTDDGTVKLLDFGVAKILNPDEYSKSVADTQIEMRILTLENAAPEQVLGEKITTRTDVYALGTLLYQLLTEEKIFNLLEQHRRTFEKAICEQVPQKPSTIISHTNSLVAVKVPERSLVTLKTIQKTLKGDLDNIILKSLKKKPERRYQSVEQFSDDIKRYLNHYPVKAQPEKFSYRAKKYIRRHQVGVVFSGILLSSLLLFIVILSIKNAAIMQQKKTAELEATRADEIADFMVDIFSSSDPNQNAGKEKTSFEMLQEGHNKINRVKDPQLKAKLLETLALVYQKLGQYPQAKKLIDEAIMIRKKQWATSDTDWARSYYRLGEIVFEMGDFDKAEKTFKKSLDYYQNSDLDDNYEKNSPNIILASIYSYQGKYLKATELDKANLKLALTKYNQNSAKIGEAYTNLGANLRHLSQFKASEKYLRLGLKARIQSKGEISLDTAHSYNQLASTLEQQQKYQQALNMAINGMKIRQKIYKDDHVEVVASLGNVAKMYTRLKQFDKAIRYKLEAITMLKKVVGIKHYYVVGSLSSLGLMYLDNNEFKLAEAAFNESINISRSMDSADSPRIAYPLTGMGKLMLKMNQPHRALGYLTQAYKIRTEKLPPQHRLTATTAAFLGEAYLRLGKKKRASFYLKQALKIFIDTDGQDHENTNKIRTLYKKSII